MSLYVPAEQAVHAEVVKPAGQKHDVLPAAEFKFPAQSEHVPAPVLVL
jgi:hypothetical protein